MSQEQRILYTWDYEDAKSRSSLWYMIALSIAIGLIIWWILTRQYWMSIVVMLISGFFFYIENNSEDHVQIDVTELGINVQDIFYDYSRIMWYSFIYDGNMSIYLRLQLKNKWIQYVNIRVDNQITTELRQILPNFIEEWNQQEVSYIEKIIHKLKL